MDASRSTVWRSSNAPNAIPATSAAMNPSASNANATGRGEGRIREGGQSASAARSNRGEPRGDEHRPDDPVATPTMTPPPRSRECRAGLDDSARDDAELARGHGQHEHHDRCGDAVVEAALDVERGGRAQRDAFVVDHCDAERRVSRRQRSATRPPTPTETTEDPAGQDAPRDHREQKADTQQPDRDRNVALSGHVHPRRIGEEHERQRDLGDPMHRRGVDVDAQRSPSGFADACTRPRRTRAGR